LDLKFATAGGPNNLANFKSSTLAVDKTAIDHVRRTIDAYGRVDGFFNNAGKSLPVSGH
jgi:hypothetical protein